MSHNPLVVRNVLNFPAWINLLRAPTFTHPEHEKALLETTIAETHF